MLTEMQKKIAIHTLLNPNSIRYSISCYGEIPVSVDIKRLKTSILNVVNLHPTLLSQVRLHKGEFELFRAKEFLEENIEFFEDEIIDENDITKKEFFSKPFSLGNDEHLYRIGLNKTKINNRPMLFLLISVHHIIFDAFSGINFLENIYDSYANKEKYTKLKTILKEEYKNYYEVKAQPKSKKAEDYYKLFDNFISNKINSKKTNEISYLKFDVSKYDNLSIRSQSAIGIYNMARSLQEENSMDKVVIGVPVPNRNSKNRNIISCLVNVLPIFVDLELENHNEILKNIEHQLFTNLRYQEFDYLAKYSKYFTNGGFDYIFTYYPSNFIVKNDEMYIDCKEIFFLEPQAKFHVVMCSNYKISVTSEIGESVINNFKNKMIGEIK